MNLTNFLIVVIFWLLSQITENQLFSKKFAELLINISFLEAELQVY